MRGLLVRLGFGLAVAAPHIGGARQLGQLVPQRAPIVGSAIGDGRPDALLECGACAAHNSRRD